VLEENIAALEKGKHCLSIFSFLIHNSILPIFAGRVFSSGLSATAAMANWVNAGSHVILSDDGYGGTQRYFRRVCHEKHGIELDFVDLTKLEELKNGLKPNTKVKRKRIIYFKFIDF
jgi:cystathionine beta-lyase/cystathionine gamma-synthase